ncbi:glycosyltransferase family 92 protein [Agrobacterium rhizogenes]|uniref:glycosyltransferase family 2 protein n=1 Tax=Rhizobium rhizogenes TaxID=359 RepID=UPI0015724CB7|nr:glycosyltransferase family 2 protein [Rhizobium rhizogenes]NTG51401.1 glycosyltransferase family 92 protein [Rhizobium rhizogenes]
MSASHSFNSTIGSVTRRNAPSLAIASIMKNEGPYILEWVAYHRAMGVNKFFIADNGSNDGSTDILRQLHDASIITHLPFPHVPGKAPQLPAYMKIIEIYGEEADWFAFIDADEFLSPTGDDISLEKIISEIPSDVGSIGVNWSVYGSSFRDEPGDGLVLERFLNRAEQSHPVNRHYKSIVRAKAFSSHAGTPHHFIIKPEYKFTYPSGEVVTYMNSESLGLSEKVEWGILKLRHYVVKSKSEFINKKISRGRATMFTDPRDMAFFQDHDRNEVVELVDKNILVHVREELKYLSQLIDIPNHLASAKLSLEHDQNKRSKTVGFIDGVLVHNNCLSAVGWCVVNGLKAEDFSAFVDGKPVVVSKVERVLRSDVTSVHPGVDLYCGFSIVIDLEQVSDSIPGARPLTVTVPNTSVSMSRMF